jgi:asparagine synthase (glutamine-hydrolysing)
MCGIFAAIGGSVDSEKCREALGLMDHRGPNFTDNQYGSEVYLGHKRLSILDLNPRSNQPFTIGNFTMVFNGEIYNYKELIKEHKLIVSTSSDTEVLLLMYIKYGSRCLNFLNGMFAIVIYNNTTKEYFIARDRLGIKPVYIAHKNKTLYVSSEIASILHMSRFEVSPFALRQYHKLRMTVNGDTLYDGIQFLKPGHYRTNKGTFKYWDLDISPKEAPKDDDLKWLIGDAVALRERSDVPQGTYLSGGLDSTIITCLSKPKHTWTVGFENLNEFKWGQLAANQLNCEHHEILVTPDEFIETAKWMVTKRKEPLSVPNEVLIYLMTKKVKEKNTVVLSGEGADELFWGYDRIFKWAHRNPKFNLSEFDQQYCYGSDKDNEVLDYALSTTIGNTSLEKVGYYFQVTHLQGLLRRLDNATMLCSVEGRVPFVDHRLVELMAGTPFEWRMGQSFKEPLKRIFGDILPTEIVNRKKIGFPVPLSNIFKEKTGKTAMDNWLDFNLKLVQNL